MRFRRKVKLFPGVYLNFSKSGISTTLGIPGASINIGKQGTFLNTGIPGTGIYDRKKIGSKGKSKTETIPHTNLETVLPNEIIGAIKSQDAETTTTQGLNELKKALIDCYQERNDLKKDIIKAKSKLTFSTILLGFSYLLIFGFFVKWFKENRNEKKECLQDLKNQLENCFVNIDMQLDPQFENLYQDIHVSFKDLLTSQKIWDLTSAVSVDQKATRSAARTSITRKPVIFDFKNIEIIKSKYDALHLQNANGGDLYLYPAFLAIVDGHKNFGLIDIRELEYNFHGQRFLEEGPVPKDALIVDKTWAKVNKNGSPDKRFKGNYQIPICQYGEMEFKSRTGLHEAYSISSYDKSLSFASKLTDYQKLIKQGTNA